MIGYPEKLAIERDEHHNKHGFDLQHDKNEEINGGLLDAAIYLLLTHSKHKNNPALQDIWPEKWDNKWRNKFDQKTLESALVVAGSLLWAEYDRIKS